MGRQVDPEAHRARREHIASAAFRCFAAKGYERTTTADVCAEAGVSSGTFFHYFPEKLAVLLALLEDRSPREPDAEPADPLAAVLDQVRASAQEAADPLVGGFVRAVAAMLDVPAVASAVAADDAAILARLEGWLGAAQAAGQVRADWPPRRMATWVSVLVDGFAGRAATAPGFDAAAETPTLVEVTRRMLMGPDPRRTTAVVLCGGTSARMGGRDKTRELVGGVSVLDRLLGSLPEAWPVCCVGEPRPTSRPVLWTRETPPGGGPVAGLDAGLRAQQRYGGTGLATPVTVVLAGDQPFAGALAEPLVTALHTRTADVDAVAAAGGGGRPQLLLAAYRTQRLRDALARGPVTGAGVYATLGSLRVASLPAEAADLLDVDTPEALSAARHRAEQQG